MRTTLASTSVGPSPARARAAASRTAAYTAKASVPSTFDTRHAVAGCAVGHARHRHLALRRHADRQVVVFAHEDDWQLVDGGEIQALVEVTFGGRAVAEIDDRDGTVTANLAGQRGARGVRNLRRNRAPAGEDLQPRWPRMGGHLAAAGARVVGLAQATPAGHRAGSCRTPDTRPGCGSRGPSRRARVRARTHCPRSSLRAPGRRCEMPAVPAG